MQNKLLFVQIVKSFVLEKRVWVQIYLHQKETHWYLDILIKVGTMKMSKGCYGFQILLY